MKKLVPYLASVAIATSALSLLTPFAASAAGNTVGETQRCIQLGQIKETPIIDDRTILVKMRGAGGFKRMDMLGNCPGLSFNGYGRSSPENSLCTSDSLSVIGPVPMICKIEKIINIDATEAAALEAKRK